MTRKLSPAEQRQYDKIIREQRHDKLMDRLEQFLDGVMVPETVTSSPWGTIAPYTGEQTSDAGSPNRPPVKINVPESITEVMEEMAMGGLITPLQMRRLSAAMAPIFEENEKLKHGKEGNQETSY